MIKYLRVSVTRPTFGCSLQGDLTVIRCPVSYYIEPKERQARANTLGSSRTIRSYRRSLLFTRAALAFLNMMSNCIEPSRFHTGIQSLTIILLFVGTITDHVKRLYQFRTTPAILSCFG